MVQTAVADTIHRAGQIIRGPWTEVILSRAAEGDLASGRLVRFGVGGTADRELQCDELPALPAADDDAIATAAVCISNAAGLTVAAGTFDGVIGRDRIIPARTVTVTCDANADWDSPVAGELLIDIYGYDASGARIKDTIARPNSGAVAFAGVTRSAFAAVDGIDFGGASGGTGTATVGVSNDKVELSLADHGVALYEPIKEDYTANYDFEQYDSVSVMQKGVVDVQVEGAVSPGDEVYVRVAAAGADFRGQFIGQDGADTPATYAKLAGARFMSAASADGYAHLELLGG